MADYNKIDQQMVRRMDRIDLRMAQESDREPLVDNPNRTLYLENIFWEDHTLIQGRVIRVFDRLKGYKDGEYLDQYGPWVLFRIEDVLEGDELAKLEIGALVLGRWNPKRKSYYPYLYKTEVLPRDPDISWLCDSLKLDATDLVK